MTDQEGGGYPESDPRYHAVRIRAQMDAVRRHAHEDAGKVDDASAKALFETTAEVLGGLIAAYEHYERGTEPAWRR